MFGILLGLIIFPIGIGILFWVLRRFKPPRAVRYVSLVIVLGLPLLAAISELKYMFLDEPFVIAVEEGDTPRVRSLLKWGQTRILTLMALQR